MLAASQVISSSSLLNTIAAVLGTGPAADAALVSSYALSYAADQGWITASSYRVLSPTTSPDGKVTGSGFTLPEYAFAALPWLNGADLTLRTAIATGKRHRQPWRVPDPMRRPTAAPPPFPPAALLGMTASNTNSQTSQQYGGWVPPLDYSAVRQMLVEQQVLDPAAETCLWPQSSQSTALQAYYSFQCPAGDYKQPPASVASGCNTCPSGVATMPVLGTVTATYTCLCSPCFAASRSPCGCSRFTGLP